MPPKSADAGCEWQRLGVDRAASQREDRVEAPVASEVVASDQPRQLRRLRGTAENENAHVLRA